MHFPIIALEELSTDRIDFVTSLDYEDTTLLRMTDYYGEMYDEDKRSMVIGSSWLKKFLEGYATLDVVAETITFLDGKTAKENFDRYLRGKAAELLYKPNLGAYDFWEAANLYDKHDVMFYINCCGKTSLDFIADAQWQNGKTYRIGNIFDAHV